MLAKFGKTLPRLLQVTASMTVIAVGFFSVGRAPAEVKESAPREFSTTAIHVLLVVALAEVIINRVAVPMLRPPTGVPPAWHTALDYLGLFLFYFAGTLAVFVLVTRSLAAITARRGLLDTIAHALLAA